MNVALLSGMMVSFCSAAPPAAMETESGPASGPAELLGVDPQFGLMLARMLGMAGALEVGRMPDAGTALAGREAPVLPQQTVPTTAAQDEATCRAMNNTLCTEPAAAADAPAETVPDAAPAAVFEGLEEEVPGHDDALPVSGAEADAPEGLLNDGDTTLISQTVNHQQAAPADSSSGRLQAGAAPVAHRAQHDSFDGHLTLAGNGKQVALTMEPDGLGKVQVNLSLDQGVVNARVLAVDPATRNLLEDHAQDILRALLHEGIAVGGFTVALDRRGRDQFDESEGRNGSDSADLPAVPAPGEAAGAAIGPGRISIIV